MSRILFVHDFSPSRCWLHATLAASAARLGAAGLALAPFNSWTAEIVPSHYFLFDLWFKRAPLPDHVIANYQGMVEILESGRDLVIMSQALSQAEHDFFWQNAAKYIDLARHESHALFVLGAPLFLLESYYREVPRACAASPGAIAGVISDIPALLERSRSRVKLVKVVANATRQCHAAPAPEVLAQVGAFLGAALVAPTAVVPHPLFYKSDLTRRLLAALEVRENAWPELDMTEAGVALAHMDAGLPEDMLSDAAARRRLADGPVSCAFEAACGVSPGTFVAPETNAELRPDRPLSGRVLRRFLARLSGASREALRRRYLNDRHLLDADQEKILDTLSRHFQSQDFRKMEIGGTEPLLTVLTMTYNQEKYIGQCMDSVLMQQTRFAVQHLVLDHHSTDTTPEVIAAYAARHPSIRPILLSQRRYTENVRGLFERCKTKYAALCDGDDYFTDPTKLQRQVDLLEANPQLAFCFHPVAATFEDGSPTIIFPGLNSLQRHGPGRSVFGLSDLAKGNFIQSNSVVYRWRFRDGLPEWFRADLTPSDWYWHMLHAEVGDGAFIPRIMSVYRRHHRAQYAAATNSSLELRRHMGVQEMETYKACKAHFGERFAASFDEVAAGALKDFAAIARNEGDATLMNHAEKAYPDFVRHFASVS